MLSNITGELAPKKEEVIIRKGRAIVFSTPPEFLKYKNHILISEEFSVLVFKRCHTALIGIKTK